MSLSREMRMHDAVQSGQCERAIRPVRMADRSTMDGAIPTLFRYWNDPIFKAALDTETAAQQDRLNALDDIRIAKKYGEPLRPITARRIANWNAWAAANNQPPMEEIQ